MQRGFAFVDMGSALEALAEKVHIQCNGLLINGKVIRISFGMPCQPGVCILQPKCPSYPAQWVGHMVPPLSVRGLPEAR